MVAAASAATAGGRSVPTPGRSPVLTTHHGGPGAHRAVSVVDEFWPDVPARFRPASALGEPVRPPEMVEGARGRRRLRWRNRLGGLARTVTAVALAAAVIFGADVHLFAPGSTS